MSRRAKLTSKSAPAPHRNWEAWLPFIGCVIALIAYFPALQAGFIWDDDRYVTSNRLLTAPDGLWRIWFSQDAPSQYVPLTYTSLWLEHSLWGFWAKGYHIVNVLLHAVNGWLLWRLLKALAIPGAWLAAALFLLHPVQVESVAWISERKNVLSLLFMLLATEAWRKSLDAPATSSTRSYWWALIFHGLALASKATACTLPVALVVVLWLKGLKLDRRRWLQIIPFITLGIGMGVIAMWWERHHQGTEGETFAMSFLERVIVAGRAVWFYLGKLLWPADLTFIYPQWQINPSDPWAYLGLLTCVIAAVLIYLARHRTGNSIGIAGLFYLGMLAPLLGFIMLYTFRFTYVADHYQYVASIGPLTLVAAGLTKGIKRLPQRRGDLQWVIFSTILLLLGALTWKQAGIYQDHGTIWHDTLAKNPNCWMAENNLGNFLARQGQPDEAIQHYQKALAIKPDYAEAHYNWADALMRQQYRDLAIQHLEEAIRIDPAHAKARNNLGIALIQAGRPKEAITQFEQAVKLRPTLSQGYLNLALALDKVGRRADAINRLQQLLALRSDDRDARRLLDHLVSLPPARNPDVSDQSALPTNP